MTDGAFGFAFIDALASRCASELLLTEQPGQDGGPLLRFSADKDPEWDAGFLRLWAGETPVDRMVQVRLGADRRGARVRQCACTPLLAGIELKRTSPALSSAR